MKFRKNLDVILYEKIRESFLRGEFKLGEKIDIDKLAEKYEVSRTPVSYTHLTGQMIKLSLNCNNGKALKMGR